MGERAVEHEYAVDTAFDSVDTACRFGPHAARNRAAVLIKAEKLDSDLGYVGKITEINSKLLEILARDEFIPVIASIATDEQGNSYNVNARKESFAPLP